MLLGRAEGGRKRREEQRRQILRRPRAYSVMKRAREEGVGKEGE